MERDFTDASGHEGIARLQAAIERSRRARANSARIHGHVTETRGRVLDAQRFALDATTRAVDCDARSDSVMVGRLERLATRAGRSLVIEDAKARLAERCGISRADAFRVLTALSNSTNRKVRDIAEEVVRVG